MRTWAVWVWLGCSGFAAAQSFADQRGPVVRVGSTEPATTTFAELRPASPIYTPDELLRMSEPQLIAIYTAAEPGPFLSGYVPGTMIFKPGSKVTVPTAKLIRATAWQGKYFHEDKMTNRTFGLRAITTPVEMGTSYVDGRPSLVFDYATSRPFFVRRYRDEVRQVSPGVYLGIMHRRDQCGATIATWFALDGRCGCRATPQAAVIVERPSRTGP
jgi:hypothetical protein